MNKIVPFLLLILLSCNSGKKTDAPTPGKAKILAVLTLADGSKLLEVFHRTIYVVPKLDSSDKKWEVVVDTVWEAERIFPKVDSAGKPVLDSAGKPVNNAPVYFRLAKDSVNWRVENKDVDLLLKKDSVKIKSTQ